MMKSEQSPLYQHRQVQTASDDAVALALAADKVAQRVLARGGKPREGDLVGVRVNLNIRTHGVVVQAIHAGNRSKGYQHNAGFFNGTVLAYEKVVTLHRAYFNVRQSTREKIAAGMESKSPMASVDGEYVEAGKPEWDGIEIRFNPHAVHLFTDLQNRPVHYAEHVTIYGHRIYARGVIVYYTADDAPQPAGDAPSNVRFEPQPYQTAHQQKGSCDSLTHQMLDSYGVCTSIAHPLF